MKEIFQNRSYKLLFMGAMVSSIGTTVYGFAAGLYIQGLFPAEFNALGEVVRNDGALYLGIIMAISAFIRVFLSPIAGVFVDKLNKVRIIYMTDFIRGFLFLASLYILRSGLSRYEILTLFIIVTALASINEAFFYPAATSATPEVVGESNIQAANGANSIIQSIQAIAGILIGMLLYGLLGIEIAILVNAISFLLSGFSEMFIKTKYKKEVIKGNKTSFITDFKFGFKYLVSTKGLLTMMLFSLLLNFAFTPFMGVGMTALFEGELQKGPWHLGWPNIVFSITMLVSGVIVGSIKLKSLTGTVRKGLIGLVGSFLVMVIIITLLSANILTYAVFYTLFLLAMMAMAAFMIITNVPLNTGMMKAIEPEVRGRVFSTIGAISGGAVPFSFLLGGYIAREYNVATLGIVCVVLLLFPTFGFLTNKKVKILLDGFEEASNGKLQEAV